MTWFRRYRIPTIALLLATLCAPTEYAFGQQPTNNVYFVHRTVTGTLNRIIVKQPSAGARPLQIEGISFYCSVDCTRTIRKGGTSSGGSPGTLSEYNDRAPDTPSASVILDGTVGGSPETVFSRILFADSEATHQGGLYLGGAGNGQIVVELTAASSGTLDILFIVSEP